MGLSSQESISFTNLEARSFDSVSEEVDTLESHIKILKSQALELSERLAEEQNKGVCFICFTNNVDSVFVDCGHKVCCFKCGREFTKCPICRKEVEYLVKITPITL